MQPARSLPAGLPRDRGRLQGQGAQDVRPGIKTWPFFTFTDSSEFEMCGRKSGNEVHF